MNVLLRFVRSAFSGIIRPLYTNPSFQIIANNKESSGGFNNCQLVSQWNGYYCNNDDLAIVTWASLDDDNRTRIVTPITITSLNLTTRNVINTFMDHGWDGFYTSMLRYSRFVSIL